MGLKSVIESKKRQRRENIAFKKIMKKRTLQVQRQAYEKESLKQAKLRGERIAREGGTGTKIRKGFENLGVGLFKGIERATRPTPVKRTPVKRRVVKRKRRRKRR